MGKKTVIRAFFAMPQKQILEACLTCHSKALSRANIQRSQHIEADLVWTNYPSIHKSATPSLADSSPVSLTHDSERRKRATLRFIQRFELFACRPFSYDSDLSCFVGRPDTRIGGAKCCSRGSHPRPRGLLQLSCSRTRSLNFDTATLFRRATNAKRR